MIDRPKLESIITLDNNPAPLVVVDFNVMAHKVRHWYETKIQGSFSPEVEDKLIKGCWALEINRGPDMLRRHSYRILFVADRRYDDTGNYWRDKFMQNSPVVQKAWIDHAEREKVDLSSLPTSYKGTRGPKTETFHRIFGIGRQYAEEYFPFFEEEGYEADDWAGCIYRLSRDSDPDSIVRKRQIFLLTIDRDWSQLVDEEHRIYFANTRVPYPKEKIQERLVGNQGVIEHTKYRMNFDISHPKELASKKVLFSDMGDNLPKGSPIELFDLCEPNQEFNIDKTRDFERLVDEVNNSKANDRPDHFDQTLRQFAKICLEAPINL